jgi:uncharacterized protein YggE
MKTTIKSIAAAALCALLLPAVAGAQTPPAGITVVGTGTATVTDWVQEVSLRFSPAIAGAPSAYAACTTAIAALGDSLHAMGMPATALIGAATVYSAGGIAAFAAGDSAAAASPPSPVAVARVQVAPADVAHFLAVTGKAGWKATTQLRPRDPVAAKDAAYRAAYADARDRAAVIAAADGHHVGKLLNVTPAIGDYFGSMLSGLTSLAAMMSRGAVAPGGVPEVTQSATFTFELLP